MALNCVAESGVSYVIGASEAQPMLTLACMIVTVPLT